MNSLKASDFDGIQGRVREHVPLADYAYFRLGGAAQIFVEPRAEADILRAMDVCVRRGAPLTILGSGTNMLIRDGGLPGVVLYLGPSAGLEVQIVEAGPDEVCVRLPSAFPKASLLDWALDQGWGGLEFSAGIPGTLGGAVYMNAGTKWGSYGEVIEQVRFYSVERGVYSKTAQEMGFKYRGHGEGLLDGKTAVLSVDLRLPRAADAQASRALVDEILCYRGARQPLELPNCGSVFKNPPNSARGAGRLIEASGLKGHQIGQAQISTKHANFILNLGGARACEVEELIVYVQTEVLRQQGVALEPEVIVMGNQ